MMSRWLRISCLGNEAHWKFNSKTHCDVGQQSLCFRDAKVYCLVVKVAVMNGASCRYGGYEMPDPYTR